MGQSHPQALGDLGVDFIPHCYTDNLESGCSSYKPLDAYESSYGATDLEKKNKNKKKKKKGARKKKSHSALAISKKGDVGV